MIAEERRELQHSSGHRSTGGRAAQGQGPVTAHRCWLNIIVATDIANPAAAALASASSVAIGGALPFPTQLLVPSAAASRVSVSTVDCTAGL